MTGGLGITGVVREGSISAALDHPGGVKYLRPGCSHGGQILPAPTFQAYCSDYARDVENKDTDLTTGSPSIRQSQGSFV